MAISSYGEGTDSSGVVRILKDLDSNITDRHVLILEDIIDTGLTLSYLMRNLGAREPASLEVCALLVKQAAARPTSRSTTSASRSRISSSSATASTSPSGTAIFRTSPFCRKNRRRRQGKPPSKGNYKGIMGATLALEIL